MGRKYQRVCVVCNKEFIGNSSNTKFCCQECRDIHRRQREKAANEKLKAQRHMRKAIGKTKLDEVLAEARKQGLSYAEYQKQKTLMKIAKGEL